MIHNYFSVLFVIKYFHCVQKRFSPCVLYFINWYFFFFWIIIKTKQAALQYWSEFPFEVQLNTRTVQYEIK